MTNLNWNPQIYAASWLSARYPSPLERVFQLFVDPDKQLESHWQDTAFSWIVAFIMVALIGAAIVEAAQWVRKQGAAGPKDKLRVKRQTKVIGALVLVPVAAVISAMWFLSSQYAYFIQLPGLVLGVAGAALIYATSLVAGHFLLWRH